MWARSTRTTATSLFVSHQQSAFRQSFSSVVRRKRPDVIVALWSKQKGPSSQQQQQQQQQRPHLLESRLRSKTHFQLDSWTSACFPTNEDVVVGKQAEVQDSFSIGFFVHKNSISKSSQAPLHFYCIVSRHHEQSQGERGFHTGH